MLGTGKVQAVTEKTSPEDILRAFYGIVDTNKYTTDKRVNEIFAKSSTGNRKVMSRKEMEEGLDNTEDIENKLNDGMTIPYINKVCQIISQFTDPFKRKCTVAMFMASGVTLRFPEEFKLRIDTDDPVRNAENEEINNLVSEFRDKLYQEFETAVLNFQAYMENNFPPEVRDEFIVKSGDYFTQADASGNIKKALVKAHRNIGVNFTDADYDKFKPYLAKYRALTRDLELPRYDRVSSFLGVDKQVMLQKGRDGLKPLLNIMPDKVIKNLVNGE